MAFRHWGFIFLSPGFDKNQHISVMESDTCRFKAIGIDMSKKEQVLEVAKSLVAEGVQCIELCGGFGPVWIARVSEAIQGAVPVGGVFYGPEARKAMLDIATSP
jgi:hypothetical protein